ncbi:hypothetical protein AAVH_38220 [Aphelenchoides avenae]|nr:hypothetical protein AAVH_38220 [Aphelenchus avenae]
MAFWNSQELENENTRLNQALRAMETENEDLKAQCRILHLQLHDRDSFNGWYAEQHIQFLSMCSKQNDNFYLQHRIHELNGIIQAKDARIGELETKLQANGRVIDVYKLESMMLQNDCERLSKITSYACNLHLTDPAAKAAIQHIIQLAAGPPSEDIMSTEAFSYDSTQATFNSNTDYFDSWKKATTWTWKPSH